MEVIKFNNVSKHYDNDKLVIDDLNLSIKKGEFVTLIGPSGCGKTTLLKLINGLIKPDNGEIVVAEKKLSQWNPIELKRNIGYVIQEIGLFPHLTVMENIGYVLNIKKIPKKQRRERAKELIHLVGMDEEYLDRYPRELSGGQKQRVGVARALAADPQIVLMDEPFGAVDEIARRELQDEILEIYRKLKKTIIFVTHDIQEAIKLGSRIILFNDGKIEQSGTREDMIFSPKNEYVEKFFGLKNFTAYLNITPIENVYSRLEEKDMSSIKERNIPYVSLDSTIMEGIKIIFDHGVDIIGVKDSNRNTVGKFSLSNAYRD